MKVLTLSLVIFLAVGTRAIDLASDQSALKPKCEYDENPTELARKGFDKIIKLGKKLAKKAKARAKSEFNGTKFDKDPVGKKKKAVDELIGLLGGGENIFADGLDILGDMVLNPIKKSIKTFVKCTDEKSAKKKARAFLKDLEKGAKEIFSSALDKNEKANEESEGPEGAILEVVRRIKELRVPIEEHITKKLEELFPNLFKENGKGPEPTHPDGEPADPEDEDTDADEEPEEDAPVPDEGDSEGDSIPMESGPDEGDSEGGSIPIESGPDEGDSEPGSSIPIESGPDEGDSEPGSSIPIESGPDEGESEEPTTTADVSLIQRKLRGAN